MIKNRLALFSCFTFPLLFTNCSDQFIPKPKGYFRIEFPEKTYQDFQNTLCPFKFEYPLYANLEADEKYRESVEDKLCWFNIEFPDFEGKIHLSYKEINAGHTLVELIEDAHTLTFKHTVKASSIDESTITTSNDVYGLVYEVGGNAASAIQFFLTDSTRHFLRGSLYFNSTPNADSVAPVVEFVKQDIIHLINTLRWKS